MEWMIRSLLSSACRIPLPLLRNYWPSFSRLIYWFWVHSLGVFPFCLSSLPYQFGISSGSGQVGSGRVGGQATLLQAKQGMVIGGWPIISYFFPYFLIYLLPLKRDLRPDIYESKWNTGGKGSRWGVETHLSKSIFIRFFKRIRPSGFCMGDYLSYFLCPSPSPIFSIIIFHCYYSLWWQDRYQRRF